MPESGRASADTDSCPQPFLISSQLLGARKALEKLFASRETEKITFLRECYGPISFKCSVVGCPHYNTGFEDLWERDNHVRSHTRPFKCPEHSCFYEAVGFVNERYLNQHISRCHPDPSHPTSNKFIFPNMRSLPTEDEQQMFREAIECDNVDLVEDLLQKNSSLLDGVRPGGGYTGLQHAAKYGKVRIAQLLLQRGSTIGAVNIAGSALSAACVWGQPEMVQFLLSKSSCEEDVNSKNFAGETPLLVSGSAVSSVSAHVEVLRLLLDDSRVLPNSKGRDGRTLLSWVAGRGDSRKVQVVKMLLNHDRIDVNAKDNMGRTPLSRAASWGVAEVVKMFLQSGRGIDVNEKDARGRSPLSWAAGRGAGSRGNAISVIEMLLEHHGVDADTTDDGDRTPLSWAASDGKEAVVEMLLLYRKGGGVDALDAGGRTPLSWAASRNVAGAVERFLARSREVNVNAEDNGGRTPLSWAAARAEGSGATLAVVQTLLNHDGINVDARDNCGRTPLSWAASEGMAGVVKVFLQCDKGVDVNAEDNEGRTPLSWATARENDPEKMQVVQALIEHGGAGGVL